MLDLTMLVYIVVLIALAVLVHRYFPPPHFPDYSRQSLAPVAYLFLLSFILTPAVLGWLSADVIRCWIHPLPEPDAMERLAQIVAAVSMLFITIRGFTVWLLLAGLGAVAWGILYGIIWLFHS
jgi:hypothetical protein